ncbi:hypothetical protein B0T16DRAFT_463263 [Cercophora newfieldiana]|uniref:Uncharacterized protein n=1 Tax=Cercophora newfieldiana TaxID=92897 RepID=A0AA39XTY7_9PEZI|nr:hypothetical protein B0T16DRAFT_463263 [Cercophora newfieldiana]
MAPLTLQQRAKVYAGAVAAHADPLSAGEIAAIAVTIGIFLIVCIVVAIWLRRKRKNKRATEEKEREKLMKAARADGVKPFRPVAKQKRSEGTNPGTQQESQKNGMLIPEDESGKTHFSGSPPERHPDTTRTLWRPNRFAAGFDCPSVKRQNDSNPRREPKTLHPQALERDARLGRG